MTIFIHPFHNSGVIISKYLYFFSSLKGPQPDVELSRAKQDDLAWRRWIQLRACHCHPPWLPHDLSSSAVIQIKWSSSLTAPEAGNNPSSWPASNLNSNSHPSSKVFIGLEDPILGHRTASVVLCNTAPVSVHPIIIHLRRVIGSSRRSRWLALAVPFITLALLPLLAAPTAVWPRRSNRITSKTRMETRTTANLDPRLR